MVNQTVICSPINDVYYLHNTTTLRAEFNLPFMKGEKAEVIGTRRMGSSFLDEMVLVLTENGTRGWIPKKFVTVM